jgi:hypothetical protein
MKKQKTKTKNKNAIQLFFFFFFFSVRRPSNKAWWMNSCHIKSKVDLDSFENWHD